jgi:nucleotide-binding universal stress UspA family protein
MRILVPIDGSKHGQAAVHFVASRSTLVGSAPQIEVLNVQLPVPARAARVVGREVVRSYYDEAAKRALKPARAVLKKAGVEASTAMRVGPRPTKSQRPPPARTATSSSWARTATAPSPG